MLWSEFIEGTGCRDNQHNWEVYKNLEIMYMNSDMSKQDIYEYGKKLVSNEKSNAELELEAKLKAEIKEYKVEIKRLNDELKRYKELLSEAKEEGSDWMMDTWKGLIKLTKDDIKYHRAQLKRLEWVLG